MARGGARIQSGPKRDPKSARSEARGFVLTALPVAGFDGDVPVFPLPDSSAREDVLWESLWRTPQACAWSLEPWRWYSVAQYVRLAVRSEAEDAPVNLVPQVIRYADMIGLTPAGLVANGWAIAVDGVEAVAASAGSGVSSKPSGGSRARLAVVKDVG